MLTIFKQNGTWIMVALFVGTLVLAINDPFGLDPMGIESTSAIKALYFIPAVIAWLFIFVKPHYTTKSVEETANIKAEQLKSIVRTVVQVLGSIISIDAAFNLKIPFLEFILTLSTYIGDNVDIAANAIMALIGIVTTIYGFFIDKNRFVTRSGLRLK